MFMSIRGEGGTPESRGLVFTRVTVYVYEGDR